MLKIKLEISIIIFIEILSKKNIPDLEMDKYSSFIGLSHVYSDINDVIAKQTISIRRKYGLKTPDAIIAATAIINKLTLISRNEKDFAKINKLDLINPCKI